VYPQEIRFAGPLKAQTQRYDIPGDISTGKKHSPVDFDEKMVNEILDLSLDQYSFHKTRLDENAIGPKKKHGDERNY